MSLAAKATRAQRRAESIMVDACSITRPGATPGAGDTTVYTGKCRVRVVSRGPELTPGTAGSQSSRFRTEVHIPATATGVRFNDLVTITDSLNPNLTDTSSRVSGIAPQTAGSAHRLWCDQEFR